MITGSMRCYSSVTSYPWVVMANAFMNNVNGVCHGVFLKSLSGTESGNVALDATGPYTGGNDTFEGHMSIWRGCEVSLNPYEGLINQTASSANMQGGAVTTLGSHRLLLHFGATVGNGQRNATPAAGYNEEWEVDCFTGLIGGTMFLHSKQITNAGAQAAATHTLNSSCRWQESAFALIPSNAGVFPNLEIFPTHISTSHDPLFIPYPAGIQFGDVAIIQAVLYDAVSNNSITPP